jgi:hypothetical protein
VDLATIAAELYGLPPKEFTATRDARASEARTAGEKDLASSLKQLRKPTVGAWMANMLVRQQPREIEQLIELGGTLRSARSLDGAEIRATTKQKLATRLGQPVSQAAEIELEATLDAAFADPESAQSLIEGDLTTALHYSGLGFGPATKGDEGGAATSRGSAPVRGSVPSAAQVTKAKRELEQARRDAGRADADVEKARQAVTATEADLKRLRAALTVAVRQASTASKHAAAAEKRLAHLSRGRTRA